MSGFKKTINGIEFNFMSVTERDEQVFRVNGDNQSFKMITDEDGTWGIWQQVPRWIKNLEGDLGDAIEEQLEQKTASQG
jgi:hypothetical protein